MKKMLKAIFLKLGGALCALAMILATNSVQNTCLYITYQPDVPELNF